MMSVNGGVLEGGGQILRNSVALSGLLAQPISVHQIRSSRKPPGLKNQHRTGLELAAEIASAKLTGAKSGSTQIEFIPGRLKVPGHFVADAVTAGSTTLLFQVALPLLLFPSSPSEHSVSRLCLKGGTNATKAPQIDYTQMSSCRGGEVVITVTPLSHPLRSFSLLERGEVGSIKGIAHFAGLPDKIGFKMVEGARKSLSAHFGGVPIEIESRRERAENTVGAGSGIVLWAELDGGGIIGGSAVGKKGLDAADLGANAAQELIRELNEKGGCVDEWLEDQIIIFMALADGVSEIRAGKGQLQLHTRTAIHIAELLTEAKFSIEELESGHRIIRCKGIGFPGNGRQKD
ncbi:hypothetical protein D9757_001674 [Collybiopsis confluens]|uniref:RNA 3'-terminal phosphate cyclase n=1 Tax=Collybiopsis confluens TaxID=2823264 RepID=A0A8H5MFH5_9AGAR|nr:hypothetical protein D9757_001674 [Collybiopsis confluens]